MNFLCNVRSHKLGSLACCLIFCIESGIIVFNIVSGNIAKKARLEVLLNDGYWPCFSTTKARSTHAQWDFTGEGFIKEIDFNRVWLRLNVADEGDRDDIVAEWKGDAKAFLRSTLVCFWTTMSVVTWLISAVECSAYIYASQ